MKVLAMAFALDDKILALSLALARLYTKTQAIDREFEFYDFFSFVKYNEFYEFFFG